MSASTPSTATQQQFDGGCVGQDSKAHDSQSSHTTDLPAAPIGEHHRGANMGMTSTPPSGMRRRSTGISALIGGMGGESSVAKDSRSNGGPTRANSSSSSNDHSKRPHVYDAPFASIATSISASSSASASPRAGETLASWTQRRPSLRARRSTASPDRNGLSNVCTCLVV